MKNRIPIREILANSTDGADVVIFGWVRTKRASKKFAFLQIYDGSCQATIQIIIESHCDAFAQLPNVTTGCALKIEGQISQSPAKGQKWEVIAKTLEVLGTCDARSYPLQKKGHSFEFLREIGYLRTRTNTFGAVFRIRNTLAQSVHNFFGKRHFLMAHTPILTANDCEGAGEMFTVTSMDLNKIPTNAKGSVDYGKDFFAKHAHLTVSGQLEAEFVALSMGNVYTFGPTFRAENSNTTRHLAEFWMVEPEMVFANLHDIMELAESFVRELLEQVLENCSDEIEFLESAYGHTSIKALENVISTKWHRISYTEAVKALTESKKDFEFPVNWGCDLQTEHERALTDEIYDTPVIVYDYPQSIKSFYMRQNDDNRTVAAMDVLIPGVGELIGGSQREERLDKLEQRMNQLNIPLKPLQWYLDLRRFGSVKHAGFGMGFERMVMYVAGMQNIRDVILCPRSPNSIGFSSTLD